MIQWLYLILLNEPLLATTTVAVEWGLGGPQGTATAVVADSCQSSVTSVHKCKLVNTILKNSMFFKIRIDKCHIIKFTIEIGGNHNCGFPLEY